MSERGRLRLKQHLSRQAIEEHPLRPDSEALRPASRLIDGDVQAARNFAGHDIRKFHRSGHHSLILGETVWMEASKSFGVAAAGRSQGNVLAAAPVDDCVQSEFPSGLAKKVFEIAAVIRISPAGRRPRNSCRCRPGVRRCVRRFSAADSSGWCAVMSREFKDRSSRTSGKRQARRR